jgi:hypothetical protein
MFVSTREATRQSPIIVVKILARPATVGRSWLSPILPEPLSLELIQPFGAFVEQGHSLLGGQLVASVGSAPYQLDSNAFAGGNPLQFIARTDAVLVGNGFGNGELELGGHLGHILTLSRMESLLQVNLQATRPAAFVFVAALTARSHARNNG